MAQRAFRWRFSGSLRLGYPGRIKMAEAVRNQPWSPRELELIVTDYFEMLQLDLARQPYSKAERNRALQELTGRSKGSIEYKHQNISAVLYRLGQPFVRGYKPAFNFQAALVETVAEHLGSFTL